MIWITLSILSVSNFEEGKMECFGFRNSYSIDQV